MGSEDRAFLRRLWQLMALHLTLDDVRKAADGLGVPWAELAGTGKSTKSLSLVMVLDEQKRVDLLIRSLAAQRPDVAWDSDQVTNRIDSYTRAGPGELSSENPFRQYLKDVSDLLQDRNLFVSQPGDEVRDHFQAQTLEVLPSLDGETKGDLVRFLHDTGLIGEAAMVDARGASLDRADLRRANLRSAKLGGANLNRADLRGADLRGAHLSGANLSGADLWGADLSQADLGGAHLWGCNLNKAILRRANLAGARLSDASLWGADLAEADLQGTFFWGVELSEANLQGAKNFTEQQLAMAKSSIGTILPDGRRSR